MDRMEDGLSSPARWRRPPRCWICVVLHRSTTERPTLHGSTTGKLVLHGSTTGRPPWLPSRWGTTRQGGGGPSGSGWVETPPPWIPCCVLELRLRREMGKRGA
ncbi:hypothetical protein SORBI_3008G045900 [Sorghum bicolor]|uniref:Uncharacterized protein n=1 Tax=Sorghum bicolor TaxID=4558 RepID=A0A1B6PBF8_SORBI|nr:hypothetical protein SORBI_3008G045900 [Sorghum bicolor]